MTARRLALAAALLVVLVPGLWRGASGQRNVPSSITLVYPKQKLFKPGDWVLYKVEGKNERGESSIDYQQVQIGLAQAYRGEDCFWLETGWGPDRDRLVWGAALVSENLFLDTLADIRGNAHMRMLQVSTAADGTPLVMPMRSLDPKRPLSDLVALRPTSTELGLDTLDTPKGPLVCRLVKVERTFRTSRDLPDSTAQQGTISVTRRWYNTDAIPITGLVREEEEKTYFMRSWPLGKPSTDFPMREVGKDVLRIELVDCGHGARPMVSDRVRITMQGEDAGIE